MEGNASPTFTAKVCERLSRAPRIVGINETFIVPETVGLSNVYNWQGYEDIWFFGERYRYRYKNFRLRLDTSAIRGGPPKTDVSCCNMTLLYW